MATLGGNHTLAAAEAVRRDADHFFFGVWAPFGNDRLLTDGSVLEGFRSILADPASLVYISVEELIEDIRKMASDNQQCLGWIQGLKLRYTVV